jgi:hypothetical protein
VNDYTKAEVGIFLHNAQVAASRDIRKDRVDALITYARLVKTGLTRDVTNGHITVGELVFVLVSLAWQIQGEGVRT